MTRQLKLLEIIPDEAHRLERVGSKQMGNSVADDWRLSERARQVGRLGLASAREALVRAGQKNAA